MDRGARSAQQGRVGLDGVESGCEAVLYVLRRVEEELVWEGLTKPSPTSRWSRWTDLYPCPITEGDQ